MEKEILETLKNIDSKLSHLCTLLKPTEDVNQNNEPEDEIISFLKDLTNELGLKDSVTIKKIVID